MRFLNHAVAYHCTTTIFEHLENRHFLAFLPGMQKWGDRFERLGQVYCPKKTLDLGGFTAKFRVRLEGDCLVKLMTNKHVDSAPSHLLRLLDGDTCSDVVVVLGDGQQIKVLLSAVTGQNFLGVGVNCSF